MRAIRNTLLIIATITLFSHAASAATILAHWPLNDGTGGATVTGADDLIDGGTFFQDATVEGTGGTWVNDATRGDVFSTTEDDRLVLGTQGIDRNVGFTWSTWVNVASSNTSDAGADVIIGSRNGAWNKVGVGGVNSWANITFTSGTIADDSWHHLAYLGDSTSVRLYMDGALLGSDATTSSATLNDKFELGGSSRFSEDTTGLFSDTAVFGEALSVKDVNLLYEFGNQFLYNAQQIALLMDIDAPGESVTLNGKNWFYRDNLNIGGPEINTLTLNSGAYFFGLSAGSGTGTAIASNATAIITPEPSTALLLVLGTAALSFRRRLSLEWRRRA